MRPICFFLLAALASAQIVDTSKSPHARLRGFRVRDVTMGEGFWTPRMRANVDASIPALLRELEDHGVVDNFRRLSGRKNAVRRGPLYTDSDLYKWMEAVAYTLETRDDPRLRATLDGLIGEVLAAQEPSGYLNTYYIDDRKEKRFTEMQRSHELYCLGHMLQAGIAYFRATGNRTLLDGGIRFASYLVENFGPQKRPALTGHPELEMAMVELYRTTGEKKYLDFAGYLLSGVERRRLGLRDADTRYTFSGIPFASRTIFEGHAVRAMYASCGATDYLAETGDAAYRSALETLWDDMTRHKMYITGGVGSRAAGEAFGEPYELPNGRAYTESCAAIGNMMWNWRMLLASGGARFAGVIERALYNGINSGMSLSGTLYCYRNPLESNGEKIRNPWYDTTCCPPNLERVLASLPGYLYAERPEGLYVNLYHTSEVRWRGGTVRQVTNYPWRGEVEIEVGVAGEFGLFPRIPAWSAKTAVSVNGEAINGVRPGDYLAIKRKWRAGDRVRLAFDMTPRLIEANPLVRENNGKVAVERGPLVYCLEQADNGPVFDTVLTLDKPFREEQRPDLLGGVVVLRHAGLRAEKPVAKEPLYRVFAAKRAGQPAGLTFIPYYAWANREMGQMQVWIGWQ